jgi:cytochrome c oxidase cbb3-type subunit 3
MPPMVPDAARADIIADYVARGFPTAHPGAEIYVKAYCKRCHGEKGEGIRYRAPNIRRFDLQTVAAVLKNGKKGVIGRMPAYRHFAPYQVTMLALYIESLASEK